MMSVKNNLANNSGWNFTRGNAVLVCQILSDILTSFPFQYVTRLLEDDSSLIHCQSGFNSQVFNPLR